MDQIPLQDDLLYSVLMGYITLSEPELNEIEPILGFFCALELNRLDGLPPFATAEGWIGLVDERVGMARSEIVCLFQG